MTGEMAVKSYKELADRPAEAPLLKLIWTAVVDVGERESLGSTPSGDRFIVPITGGKFFAGPGIDGLNGEVIVGGADRQLVDSNGYKQLDALYEMRTEDGSILTIHNKVKVDEAAPGGIYRQSVIEVTAPVGRFEWMNRRIFVGTLEPARPDRQAVIIRGWG